LHCESGADWDRIAKAREALGDRHAEADIALALVELGGFTSGIAQSG
jgi:hypothetical protein